MKGKNTIPLLKLFLPGKSVSVLNLIKCESYTLKIINVPPIYKKIAWEWFKIINLTKNNISMVIYCPPK